MSTLRISNIEAKADNSSPTVDEQLKFTNSTGDVLLHLDGRTSGITTVGINTTAQTIKFDENNNVYITGIVTATELHGTVAVGTSITYGDNEKAYFGTGLDLSIFHDGTDSRISNGGGLTYILGDVIRFRNHGDTGTVLNAALAGVDLYASTAVKLSTNASGVNVTGILTATSFSGALTGTASNASGATGDFSIADKIVHTGDTNTAIRFPSNDTVSVETAGNQRVLIDSDGRMGIGGNGIGSGLGVYLQRSSPNTTNFYEASDGTKKMIAGVDSTNDYVKIGSLSNHRVGIVANNGEKLSITTDGKIGINRSVPRSILDVFETTTGNQTAIRIGNSNTPSSANDRRIEFLDGTGSTEGTNKFTYGYIQGYRQGGSNNGGLIFGTKPDNASAPSERLRINASGKTFIHGNDATGANDTATLLNNGNTLNIHGTSSSDGISVVRYSANYGAYGINIGKSRSNTFGTNTAVQDGNELGHISFYGADGTDFNMAAQITGLVDGAVGTGGDATDMPGALSFRTSPEGSESPEERLYIAADGKIGVGINSPVGTFEIRDSKANLIVAKDGLSSIISNSDAHTTYDLIQLGAGGGLASYSSATATADTHLVHNAYRHSGGSWKYKYADTAMRLRMNSPGGAFIFDSAASGSAGGNISFTEKLRIDSGGNMRLGLDSTTTRTDSVHYGFNITGKSGTGAGSIFFNDTADNCDANIAADNGVLLITADYSDNTGDSAIKLRVDGSSEKMQITNDKGVLINHTSKTDLSDVHGLKVANVFRHQARAAASQNDRGFYSMQTGSGSYGSGYFHMKTDIATNSSAMFLITVRGYAYGSGKVIFCQTCGYCYASNNTIINTQDKSWDGTTSVSTYKSSDSKLVIRFTPGGWSSYYTGFCVDIQQQNPAKSGLDHKVTASVLDTNSTYYA